MIKIGGFAHLGDSREGYRTQYKPLSIGISTSAYSMSTEICSVVVQQENMLSLTEMLCGTECFSAVPLASTG